ncbi:diguanylate cyclase (GGDEF) domain-containing protein [Geodermatophilus obscurus]|uniref:Diguanylate cyclase (GGDEF) domain-containing protein n=1 Tax=Geodermatophilus obscurus TaxID=1861 RepID=A0A1I5GS84_9ACTN|nr:GGDEF domain-containing protein [Geodermatophilus obscurus]SFO38763.1 diguanylate cyclase (GGDEF) domain-containing protein [Geodermatophilus obscurus]
MRIPAWRAVLVAGNLLLVVYPWLPAAARDAGYLLAVTGALVSLAVTAAGARGPDRLPWVFLAAGVAALFVGEVLWTWYDLVLGVDPFPSLADAAYLAAYPLLATALALWARRSAPAERSASVLDAGIITVAAGLLAWVALISPTVSDGELGLLEQAVSVAYPVADLALLVLTVQLLLLPGQRPAATHLVTAGMLTMFTGDALYAVTSLTGTTPGPLGDLPFLLSYLLLGAVGLHPSRYSSEDTGAGGASTLRWLRLVVLTAASLLAPLTLAVQDLTGAVVDGVAIAACSAVLTLLVVLRMSGLVRQVQTQARALAEAARTDALTGAANRRAWDETLAATTSRGGAVFVVMLDLDHFKAYNDRHGHLGGDALLRSAAAAWRAELRATDLLARYGGEEFGVLLTGCDLRDAVATADRLRAAMPDGVTCSTGVAAWHPRETPAQLLGRADAALYAAKAAGRDRTVVAGPPSAPPLATVSDVAHVGG